MPDRDVVLAKVATIRKCLDRIREVTDLDPGKLEDINRQDIFVLNLQRAVQAPELDILKSILRWFSVCSLPCFVFLFVALFQLSLQFVDPSFQIGRVERFESLPPAPRRKSLFP